ncbi:MAG: hypothetical protein OHK93_000653 [Ramalina farinacea]|uniref:Uncharacterized protein n=1 Tax=Ramalina farinacea TaxID=258253 RepID=A0AA43QFB6_9LECA|nr:hypothetical protein [Ramalina farinacea]
MILWGLSPIGGQASLRLLLQGTSNTTDFRNITYLSTDSISASNADPAAEYEFLLNSLYSAALFERYEEQSASMDIWGNVKIPAIEPLIASGQQDVEGWLSVDANNNTSYSSLVGIPVSGLDQNANSTFSIESYYLVLDCSAFHVLDQGPETRVPEGGFIVEIEGILPSNEDSSTLYAGADSYPTLKLPKVGFGSGSTIDGNKDLVANCTMSRSSVESNVICNGMSCSVVRVRKSRYDSRPLAYTSLATQSQADLFASKWMKSAGSLTGGQSSPTEFFIQDPTLKHLMAPGHLQGNADLAGIQPQEFSQVFSLLFNTYWQCWLMPYWQTGNLPSNITQFNEESFQGNFAVPMVVNSTGANFTFSAEVYVCDKYWASTLIVVSSILVCCTLGGALLDYRTSSPKIFGYVSSLTRDNPYFDQPTGGSTLDGLKRSRILRDVKVRIQDVAGDEEEAVHIAFTTVGRPNRRGVPGIGLYQG